jgi:hypothetical protein
MRPYLKKPITKTGLVEWLKVKVLSSISSTGKKKSDHSCLTCLTYVTVNFPVWLRVQGGVWVILEKKELEEANWN